MSLKADEPAEKLEKGLDYFPVIIFIVLVFTLELFQVSKPTALFFSTLFSLISFFIITTIMSVKYKRPDMMQPLYPILGWLAVVFLFILIIVALHWYRIGEFTLHWVILLIAILFYFVLLFRAIHLFQEVRKRSSASKKKR